MEFIDQLPTPLLWFGLAITIAALAFYMKFVTEVLRTRQVSLGGRVFSDANKDQLVFLVYLTNIVLFGGAAAAVLIALLVELFLVRG